MKAYRVTPRVYPALSYKLVKTAVEDRSYKMSWNLDPIRGITSIILSIISLISVAFASFFYIENKYALKSNLKKIEIKLEMKIISDDSFRIRERIWDLKDRLKEDPDDKTAQEDILILAEERKQLEKKLDLLHKAEKSYK